MSKKSYIDAENWEKIAQNYIKFLKQQRAYLKHLVDDSLFKNLMEVIGPVENKAVLDAGCGEGRLARMLTERGAKTIACDVSKTMIEEAKNNEANKKLSIDYFVHNLAEPIPNNIKVDVAVSNLVLFSIFDFEKVISNISKVVKHRGSFVFSILHPCFNSTESQRYNLRNIGYGGGKVVFEINKSYKEKSAYLNEISSHYYFKQGKVNYYHRPIESYIKALSKNGFLVSDFREPTLELNQVYDKITYHHHFLPKFLIISTVKI